MTQTTHTAPATSYDSTDSDSSSSFYGDSDIEGFSSAAASDNVEFAPLGSLTSAPVGTKSAAVTQQLYIQEAGEPNAISPLDFDQMSLGDCYLVSSIGELAMWDPTAIQNMIHANSNGTYTVNLYENANGTPIDPNTFVFTPPTGAKEVSVTIAAPVFNTYDMLQPAVVNGVQEIWAPVIEGAVASLLGGYSTLEAYANNGGGFPYLAMEGLTGNAGTCIWTYSSTSSSGPQNVASITGANLLSWAESGDMMVIDTGGGATFTANNTYQLDSGHAYMFEGLTTINGQTYVQLLNPWGLDSATWEPAPIAMSEFSNLFDEVDIDTVTTGTTANIAPIVTGITMSSASGNVLSAGEVVTIQLKMSAATIVEGNTVTLSLNDGGTANYVSGSGTNTLTFSYGVAAGQNVSSLAITQINEAGSPNSIGGMGVNMYDLTGLNGQQAFTYFTGVTQNGPQINTVVPVVSGITMSGVGTTLGVGKTDTIQLDMSTAVDVAGTLSLALNDGGTANYVSGNGTNDLTFSYTVAAGQNTSSLAVTAINESGNNANDLTSTDGEQASTSLSGISQKGPTISAVVPPTVSGITMSGVGSTLDVGKAVTIQLDMSTAVDVAAGTLSLALNDGGVANYVSGNGTNDLTFSYTVGSGQNTSSLAVTTINESGNNANDLTGTNGQQASISLTGIKQSGPTINTVVPVVSGITMSGVGTTLGVGKTDTIQLDMSTAVDVAAGTLSLALNDGGVANYVSGSGTNDLTFSYTVGSGQNTSSLKVTGINESGNNANDLTSTDGEQASTSLSGITQSGPTINTAVVTPPPPPAIAAPVVTSYWAFSGGIYLVGTATQTNGSVNLYDNGVEVQSTTNWGGSYFFDQTLGVGTHALTEQSISTSGTASAMSSAMTVMMGAANDQTFTIGNTPGNTVVANFNATNDVLQFNQSLFANYAAAMNDAQQVGYNVVFNIDANDSVTLANMMKTSLSSSNFHFAATAAGTAHAA